MPYFLFYGTRGEPLKILVDTGSNKNFIHPKFAKISHPVENPFYVSSVGGSIKIFNYSQAKLFQPYSEVNVRLYHMKELRTFDAIIGHDTLSKMGAIIDTKNNLLTINNNSIPLLAYRLQEVNHIQIRDAHLEEPKRKVLLKLLTTFQDLFQPMDGKLSFTTNVKAEIRTNNDSPVYSKSYPYPQGLKSEIERQINKLLEDGIIRPSKSPYNSPIWIVPKKSDASNTKKYRMVIDFRKLNTKTISDRYPIPDTSTVLANLGKSRYFTTIDLASGFHQVLMSERDIEKTAFSVNNGKYEFVRMPFGLKNAPSIFQRVMDDVLRAYIGKICFVYIDDIIIVGETFEEHLENIKTIFETLRSANFRIQPEKCEFVKNEVEFLGFIVSASGLMPNPKKVHAIKNYPQPTNVKELRMFLGLSGYYRRFVKNYAKIAKPLTKFLKGANGHRQISKNESKNFKIKLDSEGTKAFELLKEILSSEDVLAFPDFEKPFLLTTDASNKAIGAVLSQNFHDGERPITFISKTLSSTEENYATNEKEMLAIVWALHSLRNFIYGQKIIIYTDHQPLTYAISPKNNNAKLKRWKAFLEEHDHEIHYKPGKANVVADALSRVQINSLTATQNSADDDDNSFIPSTEAPLNVFKNQIIFKIGNRSSYGLVVPFEGFKRHIFIEPRFTIEFLIEKLKNFLNPSVVNGIFTTEPIMATIQEIYRQHFDPRIIKARFSQLKVQDIQDEERQLEEIKKVHQFAHRNATENIEQLLKSFYFPKMTKIIKQFVKNCEVCKTEKYERNPQKFVQFKTPIPKQPGEIIHVDIFVYDINNLFLTTIDKFSKYLRYRAIESKSLLDVEDALLDLLHEWNIPKMVVMDNESSLNSNVIEQRLRNLDIQIFRTPIHRSETNGQIERCHSTLREISRCIKKDVPDIDVAQLIRSTVHKYNNSIHSFVKNTPNNIYIGDINKNLDADEMIKQKTKSREKVINLYQKKNEHIQEKQYPTFNPGTYVFEKTYDISKRKSRYKKIKIKENHDTYIIDTNNRKIHKINIRKE